MWLRDPMLGSLDSQTIGGWRHVMLNPSVCGVSTRSMIQTQSSRNHSHSFAAELQVGLTTSQFVLPKNSLMFHHVRSPKGRETKTQIMAGYIWYHPQLWFMTLGMLDISVFLFKWWYIVVSTCYVSTGLRRSPNACGSWLHAGRERGSWEVSWEIRHSLERRGKRLGMTWPQCFILVDLQHPSTCDHFQINKKKAEYCSWKSVESKRAMLSALGCFFFSETVMLNVDKCPEFRNVEQTNWVEVPWFLFKR